jgi:hypothetical protein
MPKDFPMPEFTALYGALHRSFAAVRRGDRIEAEHWLKIAERIGCIQQALTLMAKVEAAEQARISDPKIGEGAEGGALD